MESLLHETNQDGFNMLHHAAQGGHPDVVRLAVEEYKLDPAARDKVSVCTRPIGVASGVL